MSKTATGGTTLGTVIVLMLATARPASAYTDPGSGAMLWQMLTAAMVGGVFYFRRFLSTLLRKTKRR
jgi:hypothetical protein